MFQDSILGTVYLNKKKKIYSIWDTIIRQNGQSTQIIFRAMKIICMILLWWTHVITHLSKPVAYVTSKVNLWVNYGTLHDNPGLERSPGGGHDSPHQCSCLENPHGQRSLEGYGPWGFKESDMIERLNTAYCTWVK